MKISIENIGPFDSCISVFNTPIHAVAYCRGVSRLGDGFRNIELVNVNKKIITVRYLNTKVVTRTANITISKFDGNLKGTIYDNHLWVVDENESCLDLGPCDELVVTCVDTSNELQTTILNSIRSIKMDIASIKTMKDVLAMCPKVLCCGGDFPTDGAPHYLVYATANKLLCYSMEGKRELIPIPKITRLKVLASAPNKVETSRNTNGMLQIKYTINGQSRFVLENLYDESDKKLVELAQKLPTNINECIEEKVKIGSDCESNVQRRIKMTDEVNAPVTTETAADAPKRGRGRPRTKEESPFPKIENPLGADGKPRRGRPPVGWRETKIKEMLAAGKITEAIAEQMLAAEKEDKPAPAVEAPTE